MNEEELFTVYVYPDGEVYEHPSTWKSDDYQERKTAYCNKCESMIEPHYMEPFASCNCGTQEWYY